ncbi:MAG: hypothetical protein LBQ78_01995 [Tannerellaceae bacterium]|nr:hypothetical protein [Tannerellaceae bacterium]
MRINLQLGMAILLTLSGIALLFCGFWIDPKGEIESSVLVAFGETCTFSGALFGVDYRYKVWQHDRFNKNKQGFYVGRDDAKRDGKEARHRE